MVDMALYRAGKRILGATDVDQADMLRKRACEPGDFAWIELHDPTEAEFATVADAFDLHHLAVEDALTSHQRPKLELYGDTILLVLKTLWYVEETDQVETEEIHLIAHRDFVISVSHGKGIDLAEVTNRLESRPEWLSHGSSAPVWAIADAASKSYLSVLDSLNDDVEEVEGSVFSDARTRDAARIYTLKRELGEVRRAVQPLREPIRACADGLVDFIGAEIHPYFRDVLDQVNQAAELSEQLEAMLSTAFEAHLAQISVQQNDDMRKISAGAALVVVPTFIAGVYGMNFALMPANDTRFGFWFALSLMGAAIGGLWVFFRRSGWF